MWNPSASRWTGIPKRFHSVVMLNPLTPGADTRCANALGDFEINGIFLFPAMHR